MVGVDEFESLNHVEILVDIVAGVIQPDVIEKINGIDDQGVAFPLTTRVSEIPVDVSRRMRRAIGVDEAMRLSILIEHRNLVTLGQLEYLERKIARVSNAWNTRQIALRKLRIVCTSLLEVVLTLFQCFG